MRQHLISMIDTIPEFAGKVKDTSPLIVEDEDLPMINVRMGDESLFDETNRTLDGFEELFRVGIHLEISHKTPTMGDWIDDTIQVLRDKIREDETLNGNAITIFYIGTDEPNTTADGETTSVQFTFSCEAHYFE